MKRAGVLFARCVFGRGVLVAASALVVGCNWIPTEVVEAPPALVAPVKNERVTYTVRQGTIVDKVTLRAVFAPMQTADLFFRQGGRLKTVHVRLGQKVEKGQVLAELFAEDVEYQLAQAEIRHRKVQVSLAEVQRKEQLNPSPEAASERSRLELDLEATRLEVERYRTLLANSTLAAPFAGQVMSVDVAPGEAVNPYERSIVIADPSKLWIEADVTDSELSRLVVGQKVRLEFSELAKDGVGTVVALPETRDQRVAGESKQKRVTVQLEGPAPGAYMGMVGKVHIILQEKQNAILLPNAAVRRFSSRTYVLTAEPRREVDVQVGIDNGTEVEILSGLKPGQVVIGR